MKVILFMTMSANGIIADENGSEDIFSEGTWAEFVKAAQHSGCVIWGRKTYEYVKTWGEESLGPISNVKKVIITRGDSLKNENGLIVADSPQDALNKLEKEGYKEVLLSGGATNNSSFAKLGLIDEVIINVETFFIGKGVPLFSPENFTLNLEIMESKKINEKITQNHYKVLK